MLNVGNGVGTDLFEGVVFGLLDDLPLSVVVDVDVVAVAVEAAHLIVDILDKVVEALAGLGHVLGDHQADPDAVPLGDVAADGQSP